MGKKKTWGKSEKSQKHMHISGAFLNDFFFVLLYFMFVLNAHTRKGAQRETKCERERKTRILFYVLISRVRVGIYIYIVHVFQEYK